MYTTVYYPQFWYSRFLNISPASFDGALDRSAPRLHKQHFRLLSLVFRNIYIPRTHLITETSPIQSTITSELFKSHDFRFLLESGIIRISTLSGLDSSQDSERIVSRAAETAAMTYASSQSYLKSIPTTQSYSVERIEAQRNKIEFPKYAALLKLIDPILASAVLDAVDSAQLRDVPFFHEQFIRSLKDKLPQEQFDRVWRDTNSIYLISPAPTEPGLVAYFDTDLEAISFRFWPDGLDRYLFSPQAIFTYLRLFLTEAEIARFLNGPIEKSHRFLISGGHLAVSVEHFRKEYFSLVRTISEITRDTLAATDLNLQTVSALFEAVLNPGTKSKLSAVGGAAEHMRTLGALTHLPGAAWVAALAKPAVQFGGAYIEQAIRSAKAPNTTQFLRLLKLDLRESV